MKKSRVRIAAAFLALFFLMPAVCGASFAEDKTALLQDSEFFKDKGFDGASGILAAAKNKGGQSFVLVYYSRYDAASKSVMPYIKAFADENSILVYGIDQNNRYTPEYGYYNVNTVLVGWEDFIDRRDFAFPAVFVYNADVRMMTAASGVRSVIEFSGLLSAAGLLKSEYHDLITAGEYAQKLFDLGVFLGTGEGAELLREPTRVEALAMVVRLTGKRAEAEASEKDHPFSDVPEWADGYVTYAYKNGITNGVSATRFGAEDKITAAQYLTMILRALSFKSGEKGDFIWNDPFDKAMSVGILPDGVNTASFLRADMVTVSYAALTAKAKNSDADMADMLLLSGAVDAQRLRSVTGIDRPDPFFPDDEEPGAYMND